MTNTEFERTYLPKYNSAIRAIARKLAQTNDTLAEELYQEGIIALWRCDLKKIQTDEDAYIRQTVKFRMIDFLRRERLDRLESLDFHLDNGQQMVEGDNGEIVLADQARVHRRKWSQERVNPWTGEDE